MHAPVLPGAGDAPLRLIPSLMRTCPLFSSRPCSHSGGIPLPLPAILLLVWQRTDFSHGRAVRDVHRLDRLHRLAAQAPPLQRVEPLLLGRGVACRGGCVYVCVGWGVYVRLSVCVSVIAKGGATAQQHRAACTLLAHARSHANKYSPISPSSKFHLGWVMSKGARLMRWLRPCRPSFTSSTACAGVDGDWVKGLEQKQRAHKTECHQ
jgi:hypothetical protein